MGEYTLKKEDYKLIKEMAAIAQSILKIYKKLCSLEINNKKESLLYKTLLTELKELIDDEKELYEMLDKDADKISEMLSYILDNNVYDISEVLQLINQMENSGLIKARMAEKLEHLLSNIGFVISDVSEEQEYPLYEEDLDVLDELSEIEEPENIEKQFFYSEKLSTETEKDILNTALKILEEYLVNDDYKNIKINLIEFKYRMSYLFQNLEYEFLKDIFGIKEKLYWGAELIVDLGRGEKEDLVLCKNSYAEDMLYDQEENLMNFKYQDLNNIDVYASAIICQIIIRAALLFVDDERRENFKEFFLSEYEFGNKENSILDKIVADTFSKYEKDLELPWILSLKPKQ